VPSLSLLGMALTHAACQNAVDIVLNAVAVTFILELDGFMFWALFPGRLRRAFEERQLASPPSFSPLLVSGGQLACWVCTSLIFALDLLVMTALYLSAIHIIAQETDHLLTDDKLRKQVTFLCLGRVVLATLFELWLTHAQYRSSPRLESTRRHSLRLLAHAVSVLAVSVFMFSLCWGILRRYLGNRGADALTFDPAVAGCVDMRPELVLPGTNASDDLFSLEARRKCQDLQNEAIFSELTEHLRRTVGSGTSFAKHMRSFWEDPFILSGVEAANITRLSRDLPRRWT